MAETFSVEFEAKSDAHKIWDFVKNFHLICHDAFPQFYDSVETLEGDGSSTGTVRIIRYVPGIPITNIKERLDLVDDENKIISYTFLDGDIFQIYKSFEATLALDPKADGTTMKFYGKYEKAAGVKTFAESVQDFVDFTFGALDKYLLSH
ncbi:MLP-like protein 423 [Dorcoceras hygrometricum]|uniref:MLP-like protein 423 n=1 Tax=Dorcoceras hygrometricum TaxID=472368 RepID=A0A2Z7CWH0_9LAMI|nr:MLP-like protein 423 [Dorcoceras hygrometricum]